MTSVAANETGAVFTSPAFDRHEEVIFCTDAKSGLRAIIAIHDTTLGLALGGCHMWPYENEQEAITDVLRLSRAMSFKNALAQLSTGGGKSVIIGDPERDKSETLFHAFGRFVENLGGRHIVAEDVDDMSHIRSQTSHVMGFSARQGSSGDPSPITAYGVFFAVSRPPSSFVSAASISPASASPCKVLAMSVISFVNTFMRPAPN